MEQFKKPDNQNNEPTRVAIADDHIMIRELLVENINALPGFRVILSAGNGAELLQGLELSERLPDICLLDISMPVMNGYETQAAIKRRWPGIKSLAISIYDDAACINEMFKNGADGFITKQSEPGIIHEALVTVHNGDFYYKQLPVSSMKKTEAIPSMTEREKEYLTLLCSGMSMEKIAAQMDITTRTVEHYRDSIYHKLNVNNRADVIFYVLRTGIVYIKK